MRQIIKDISRKFITAGSAFGISISFIDGLEPVLKLSKAARYLLENWNAAIEAFWKPILYFVNIQLTSDIYNALTASFFFVVLGALSAPRVLAFFGIEVLSSSNRARLLSSVFNFVVLGVYAVYSVIAYYSDVLGAANVYRIILWSSPIFLFCFSLFFLTVEISDASLLRRKLFWSLVFLIALLLLDRFLDPLAVIVDALD